MCDKFDGEIPYLRKDTSIVCWEGNNTIFQISIGLTFIIIWAIIFPFAIFNLIKNERNHLNETRNLKLYGIFYVGLTDGNFYWEIIIMNIRKLALIFTATFLNNG